MLRLSFSLALIAIVWSSLGCSSKQTVQPTIRQAVTTSITAIKSSEPKKKFGFNQILEFESTRIDFGKITGVEPVHRSVSLKNLGTETVVIQDITSSCPCSWAMPSNLEISPGGESKLHITVDPKRAAQKFTALISVGYVDNLQIDRVQILGQVSKHSRGK